MESSTFNWQLGQRSKISFFSFLKLITLLKLSVIHFFSIDDVECLVFKEHVTFVFFNLFWIAIQILRTKYSKVHKNCRKMEKTRFMRILYSVIKKLKVKVRSYFRTQHTDLCRDTMVEKHYIGSFGSTKVTTIKLLKLF